MDTKIIALAGNPNVGKSTLFNALTGLKQHTGNWPGKTVTNAEGKMKYKDTMLEFIDLPGAYTLSSDSPDEKVTGDYITSKKADIVLIIADATCLERNLLLVQEILAITCNAVLCLNLMDEAEKKNISIDIEKLHKILQIPVIPTAARSKKGLSQLLDELTSFNTDANQRRDNPFYNMSPNDNSYSELSPEQIFSQCVTFCSIEPHSFDRKLDKILTSKLFGFPIMILLLIMIFWLTMTGANYPSMALSSFFALMDESIRSFMGSISFPPKVESFVMDGIYRTLSWVVSVMLPPMAIFFPLFTLLEDFGYLPRIAFNLDNSFKKCGAHGKQSLTMCMGLGCNACGVMGCRIIESPRERLIAIITNSFIPCNGKFPTLIALILIFLTAGISGNAALNSNSAAKTAAAGFILAAFIMLSIAVSLIMSKLLSATVLKGIPSSFILELPPYRKPKIGNVIIRSIFDRTIFVLGRAVIVAAPAGAIIWLLANIASGDISLLNRFTDLLDPFGQLLGVDGVIIAAFILGFPANEIVIPIMLMCYMSSGALTEYASLSQLHSILTDCGWTMHTAISVTILCLFHFPCGTTCLTIKKETGSLKWTAVSVILPIITGISLCLIINICIYLFQLSF